jgi:hypothetical protein
MPSYMAHGFQVVGEAVARRWGTPQGRLIDDPDYGRDVSDLIGDDLSPAQIVAEAQQLAAEAEKDERVLSCQVALDLSVAGALTVTAQIVTAAGPFKLVLGVSSVSPVTLQVSQ